MAALSTGVQVRNVTSRVARIRLWGAHVHEVMRKVLQPVGPPSDAAKVHCSCYHRYTSAADGVHATRQAWEAVTANAGSSEGYARRCILSLIVRDPRLRVAAEESRALGVPNTWPEVSVKSVLWMDGTYATCPPDHVLNARRAEVCGGEERSVPHNLYDLHDAAGGVLCRIAFGSIGARAGLSGAVERGVGNVNACLICNGVLGGLGARRRARGCAQRCGPDHHGYGHGGVSA